jgi:hypothetical protein
MKHKSDAGAGPVGKCAMVSGHNAVPSKAPAAPKSVCMASSKIMLMKATHVKSAPKTSVATGAVVLPKPGVPSGTAVSKTAMTVTAPWAGVLNISTGTKRLATAPSPTAKGKQERVDVGPPAASSATCKASVQL